MRSSCRNNCKLFEIQLFPTATTNQGANNRGHKIVPKKKECKEIMQTSLKNEL